MLEGGLKCFRKIPIRDELLLPFRAENELKIINPIYSMVLFIDEISLCLIRFIHESTVEITDVCSILFNIFNEIETATVSIVTK